MAETENLDLYVQGDTKATRARNRSILERLIELIERHGGSHDAAIDALDAESGPYMTRTNLLLITRPWRTAHPDTTSTVFTARELRVQLLSLEQQVDVIREDLEDLRTVVTALAHTLGAITVPTWESLMAWKPDAQT